MMLEESSTNTRTTHEKPEFLRKDNNAEKSRRQQEEKKANYAMIDSIKGATDLSLQELAGLLSTGHCDHHSFIELPGVRANSTAHNTHND